jgi:DNA-binding NarL/FixJ family response regulator
MRNKQAASALGISAATLQIYRGRIMQKMSAVSFADLVRIADALGIVHRRERYIGLCESSRSDRRPG